MTVALGWWENHWSEVAAVALALGFLALVGGALRTSLTLGPPPRRRPGRSREPVSASLRSLELIRFDELERRLSDLERRLPSPPQEAARGRPLREVILEMAETGQSPREIAESLDEPLGRVELVLNLSRTRQER